ncbi:uncharacterized protein HD556DRAFT_1440329 [Suillus plorans]|uniref:LysM domain-containing protein n=1 Tax=Suillus plorans TaxID=116603 RepID=A0A9P7DMP1_9AGAM|nr:uncharacterized protein HD556DRAFT_1440329 [Suillus plorans]KAG1798630.1 hypothetical protein HD556DRAFT_1440329 [Suillus plorans]
MHASFFTAGLVALAAIASVVSAQSILPTNCDRNVTVRAMDTCDGISAVQSVSTYQLTAANEGTIDPGCDNLFIGQIICLGLSGQDCDVTHVMGAGDTCQSVADAAGIPISTLLTNNPNVNSNCDNVYTGEVLCTASQIYVKAA